jgi:hypothetical protein
MRPPDSQPLDAASTASAPAGTGGAAGRRRGPVLGRVSPRRPIPRAALGALLRIVVSAAAGALATAAVVCMALGGVVAVQVPGVVEWIFGNGALRVAIAGMWVTGGAMAFLLLDRPIRRLVRRGSSRRCPPPPDGAT